MKRKIILLPACIFACLLAGCDRGTSDQAENDAQNQPRTQPSGDLNRFNGVWEVIGRTGNEDGSNEPVCGHETALGTVTIEAAKITGNITNKSGFEYTVEGSIDNSGKIEAMLIYQGYDAAELFGIFSPETNSGKGNWKDAVNACPGIWQATRIANAASKAAAPQPATPQDNSPNVPSEPNQPQKSG
ncbi:MAG: hypothetical protein ACRER2_00640 [Methylococcales bacterium]